MTFCNANDYQDIAEVLDLYIDAWCVVEVDDGWMVFETSREYEAWKTQQ